MASTISHPLFYLPLLRVRALCSNHSTTSAAFRQSKPPSHSRLTALYPSRRDFVLLLTTTPILTVLQPPPSLAEDIPLFGLRKKIKNAEEKTEEIVREGFEAAEKGIEAAEKGFEATEKEIETAEKTIESSAGSFNGLAQAGVVAGAEAFAVVIATSVVNGILGPESQKS